MWRINIIILIVFFCSCKQNKEFSKSEIKAKEANFYDLYALHKLKDTNYLNRHRVKNYDSLILIKDIDVLFDKMSGLNLLDSLQLHKIKKNYGNSTLEFSEKIRKRLEKSKGKNQIIESFSQLYFLDENHVFLFNNTSGFMSGAFSVIFFSKSDTIQNSWQLDSTKILQNYRGCFYPIEVYDFEESK